MTRLLLLLNTLALTCVVTLGVVEVTPTQTSLIDQRPGLIARQAVMGEDAPSPTLVRHARLAF
ncbi:hypothetical protein [Pseudomonas fulva]|nr:hypothetical protein [Pseudomonas fulva]MBF8779295.1 hypothetical protein [Pseudomonas fulva]